MSTKSCGDIAPPVQTLRAIIYARASIGAEHDRTVKEQLRKCRKWARRHNAQVVSEHVDRHPLKGSRKLPERIEARRALQPGDALVVDTYDRLSRSSAEFLRLIESLERKGCTLVSARADDSRTNAYMVAVIKGLAELERDYEAGRL